MKINTASLSILGTLVLVALLFISILKIQRVFAQVDATSSDAVVASSTDSTPAIDATTTNDTDTAPLVLGASASDAPNTDAASSPVTTTPSFTADQ
jgi:hypothetical protein